MFDGKFKKLTNDPGLTTNAAISLDGKLVAYASDRADPSNLDIWVQQVGGGHAIRITDDPADDDEPTFSPDGSQIAFRSERKEPGIYVAPALGGETRLLIPHGKSPRFSPNGKMLMYWTEETGSAHEALFVQALTGGAPTRIVDAQPPGTACHVYSDIWSPASTHILFEEYCGFAIHTIWNATLDGKRVPLAAHAPEYSPIDLWPTNPPRILGRTDAGDGVSTIAAPISADGTKVTGPWQRITFGTGTVSPRQASGAANGRIAISNLNSEMHIWAILIDPSGHARGAPEQLTSGSGEIFPALSRDGRGMNFTSLPDLDVYYRDLKTGKQVQLFSQSLGSVVFSPDGTKIIG
jgi:Tol biopolymer transport system component